MATCPELEVTLIVALGMTAPDGSAIRPRIAPVLFCVACANAESGRPTHKIIAKRYKIRIAGARREMPYRLHRGSGRRAAESCLARWITHSGLHGGYQISALSEARDLNEIEVAPRCRSCSCERLGNGWCEKSEHLQQYGSVRPAVRFRPALMFGFRPCKAQTL